MFNSKKSNFSYVQFDEYVSFVRAMDEFRGMKLVRKDGEKNMAVSISVDFDRTKHMSDMTIKRRKVVRDRLVLKEQAKEEDEKKKLQEIENRKDRERLSYFIVFVFRSYFV